MAKDKSPKRESKKPKKDKTVIKGSMPDLSKAMDKVPMSGLKSLKVKMKFKDND